MEERGVCRRREESGGRSVKGGVWREESGGWREEGEKSLEGGVWGEESGGRREESGGRREESGEKRAASGGRREESGGRSLERSEEHTSELQSQNSNSYAVLCLKKKKI